MAKKLDYLMIQNHCHSSRRAFGFIVKVKLVVGPLNPREYFGSDIKVPQVLGGALSRSEAAMAKNLLV